MNEAEAPRPNDQGFLGRVGVILAGLVGLVGVLTVLLGGIPKLVDAYHQAYCSIASCVTEAHARGGGSTAPLNGNACKSGLVWREAFDGDTVCVSPDVRKATLADNAAAADRVKPDGFCKSGYVWREARSTDHVCVAPDVRSQVGAENAAASKP